MANKFVRLLNGNVMELTVTSLTLKDGEGRKVTGEISFSFDSPVVEKFEEVPDQGFPGEVFLELSQGILPDGILPSAYITGSASEDLIFHLPIPVNGFKRDLSRDLVNDKKKA